MKKSNFWFLTLCALLLIGSATGWSIPIRIAVAANAAVVLIETVREAVTIYKMRRGDRDEPTERNTQS